MEQEIEYVIHQTLTLTDADTADEAKGIVTKVETDVSYCGAHLLRIVDDRHPFRTYDKDFTTKKNKDLESVEVGTPYPATDIQVLLFKGSRVFFISLTSTSQIYETSDK